MVDICYWRNWNSDHTRQCRDNKPQQCGWTQCHKHSIKQKIKQTTQQQNTQNHVCIYETCLQLYVLYKKTCSLMSVKFIYIYIYIWYINAANGILLFAFILYFIMYVKLFAIEWCDIGYTRVCSRALCIFSVWRYYNITEIETLYITHTYTSVYKQKLCV